MACLGVHFALTDDELNTLIEFSDEQKRLDHLKEVIEEELLETQRAVETEHAWDGLHRSLTDGNFEWENGTFPLNAVILHGEPLHFKDDYIMSLKRKQFVPDIAEALALVTPDDLRSGYAKIDTDTCPWPTSEEDLEYTLDFLQPLQQFWTYAASEGLHCLFTADQ
ncbi:MAG: DUF1877 family protein [Phycisphaerales bacterium JB040]